MEGETVHLYRLVVYTGTYVAVVLAADLGTVIQIYQIIFLLFQTLQRSTWHLFGGGHRGGGEGLLGGEHCDREHGLYSSPRS